MKNILIFTSLLFISYFVILRMIKIRKNNNHLQLIIPITTILLFADTLLNIKYNHLSQIYIVFFNYIMLAIMLPLYHINLKSNIKLPKSIKNILIIISLFLFFKIVFTTGVKSTIFPIMYLLFEFIMSNNFKNIKQKKLKFSISYNDYFNQLSLMEKKQYASLMIRAITVFFAIITMTMLTISTTGFMYQIIFISFISFIFIKNIKSGKFKNFQNKIEK